MRCALYQDTSMYRIKNDKNVSVTSMKVKFHNIRAFSYKKWTCVVCCIYQLRIRTVNTLLNYEGDLQHVVANNVMI